MGRIKKAIVNAITKRALTNANRHLKEWKKSGDIDTETFEAFRAKAADIEGIVIDKKGNLAVGGDLDNDALESLKAALPTLRQLKKSISTIDSELKDIKISNAKERAQAMAELAFKAEVRRLRNKAADELWDIYYDDHDAPKDKRLKSENLFGLDSRVQADLADELKDLGGKMSRGQASAQDIMDFTQKVKDATGRTFS